MSNNRGFARRGTHPYAHNFVPPLGFHLVWSGIEKTKTKKKKQKKKQKKKKNKQTNKKQKQNKKTHTLKLLNYFIERIKISTEIQQSWISNVLR